MHFKLFYFPSTFHLNLMMAMRQDGHMFGAASVCNKGCCSSAFLLIPGVINALFLEGVHQSLSLPFQRPLPCMGWITARYQGSKARPLRMKKMESYVAL